MLDACIFLCTGAYVIGGVYRGAVVAPFARKHQHTCLCIAVVGYSLCVI